MESLPSNIAENGRCVLSAPVSDFAGRGMNLDAVNRRAVLAATTGFVVAGPRFEGTIQNMNDAPTDGESSENHIVISGGGPKRRIEYEFTVSGHLQRSGRSADAPVPDSAVTVDGEDTISDGGRRASGAVAGGADAYRFSGRIVRFRLATTAAREDEVRVFLNGNRRQASELGDNPAADTPIRFVDCTTAKVEGEFRGVRMHTSFWDETGLGTNVLFPGPVSGTTRLHPAAEHEPNPFAIDSVSLDTQTLETPGQPAQFTADNPYAGPWCRNSERTIEFLDCDRAVVTGEFERVAISTSWYAPDGIATSYNQIGPVSGRTTIDRSNVGDIGESGFVISEISAYESGSAEPTLSERPSNFDACLDGIRPGNTTN